MGKKILTWSGVALFALAAAFFFTGQRGTAALLLVLGVAALPFDFWPWMDVGEDYSDSPPADGGDD